MDFQFITQKKFISPQKELKSEKKIDFFNPLCFLSRQWERIQTAGDGGYALGISRHICSRMQYKLHHPTSGCRSDVSTSNKRLPHNNKNINSRRWRLRPSAHIVLGTSPTSNCQTSNITVRKKSFLTPSIKDNGQEFIFFFIHFIHQLLLFQSFTIPISKLYN